MFGQPHMVILRRQMTPVVANDTPTLQPKLMTDEACPLLSGDESAEMALLLGAFDRPAKLVPAYHYGVEGRRLLVCSGFGTSWGPTIWGTG